MLLPDEPEPESIVDQYKTCLESIEKRTPGRNCLLRGGGRSSVFYLGKLFGMKTIYIEVFDRIDKPTMTGKMVYPVTDRFIVQWEEMKQVYKKAINLGSIF